jgi:hypothetical protein
MVSGVPRTTHHQTVSSVCKCSILLEYGVLHIWLASFALLRTTTELVGTTPSIINRE